MHAITNLCAMKRKPLRCVSSRLHDISYLFLVMHMHTITNLCAMKRTQLRCVSVNCMTSNLFLVMHMHAITKLCAVKTSKICFSALHDISNLCSFLFTAQRLVIMCICITRNELDLSCNAMKHILGVFFSDLRCYAQSLVIACICIQCDETHLRCFFFSLHRG